MIYNKFDIVKVPFPFTDKQTVKRRPALVISSGDYQMNYNHCILAMITSAIQSSWIDDVIITDILTAGLPVPSKIRLKIFSLDISLILDKLGYLVDEDKQLLQLKLKKYL